MNSKNEILSRLRQKNSVDQKGNLPQKKDKDFFIDFPGSSDNLIDIFKKQLNELSGELYLVNSKEEAISILEILLEQVEPAQCKAHKFPLIEELIKLSPEMKSYLTYIDDIEISSPEYAKFEVGISSADFLIARTGSILIRALTAGGRRLSVLPPIHIVIAEEKQMVASLDTVLHFLNLNQDDWGYATIISGPSRTADIEKQLVLGAHGPKRLIVILIKG
jgi:L-lactate dehydrogenase complex protein LldG